jgi:hypothetical protein
MLDAVALNRCEAACMPAAEISVALLMAAWWPPQVKRDVIYWLAF